MRLHLRKTGRGSKAATAKNASKLQSMQAVCTAGGLMVDQSFEGILSVTSEQFTALAQLLRLRQGPAQDAVRLHLVQGLSVPDAARAAGVDYQLALKAVYRVNVGLDLAKLAVG
jgi:hypothetical protein